MQRQSLGSPSRERLSQLTDETVSYNNDDFKRRESLPSSFSISEITAVADADEIKPEKPHRCHSQPEKFIHLIPVLVVLCFLVLYFSSHDPSPQDLAQFHGFKYQHPDKIIEMKDVVADIQKGDNYKKKELKRMVAFKIRSLSNLQQQGEDKEEQEMIIQRDTTPQVRSHRKLADF